MKTTRFTDEQIIAFLKQAEAGLTKVTGRLHLMKLSDEL
jgi:hypothetical protein